MTGKNTMYEAAARVPMILTGPGITPGTLVPALASLFDVYPTVLDLMGLASKTPDDLAGSSVLPLAQKQQPTPPNRKDFIVSECVRRTTHAVTACHSWRSALDPNSI